MGMTSARSEETDLKWMARAYELARQAADHDEVPVGAVLVNAGNECIGTGWNRPISANDPTAHAEIMALREASAAMQNYRLPGTTLYVTLEPCPMCAGAIVHARVARIVIAAMDPRTGAAGSVFNLLESPQLNHCVDITRGVMQEECSKLLRDFFVEKRNKTGSDIK